MYDYPNELRRLLASLGPNEALGPDELANLLGGPGTTRMESGDQPSREGERQQRIADYILSQGDQPSREMMRQPEANSLRALMDYGDQPSRAMLRGSQQPSFADSGDQPSRQAESQGNALRALISGDFPDQVSRTMGRASAPSPVSPDLASLSTDELRRAYHPAQGGFVRNENTGQTLFLNGQPGGISDSPDLSQGGGSGARPGGQVRIKMAGYSNSGIMSDLGETTGPAPQIDMSRPAVDTPKGRGYYGKDGGVYVRGPDGWTKIVMGYDQQASTARQREDLARRKGEQDIAQSQAGVEHTQEETRVSRANNPDNGPGTARGDAIRSGMAGDQYLQTLDPGRAAIVKQLLAGKMAPPNGMALRNPQVLQLMEDAAIAEPGFDAATWAQRFKTAQDFASGGSSGKLITAYSTLLDHVANVAKAGKDLNNFGAFPFSNDVNSLVNNLEGRSGDPRVSSFVTAKTNFDNELAKAMTSGHVTDTSIAKQAQSLGLGQSDAQREAALQQIVSMLGSKINETGNAYIRGMGKGGLNPADLLTPGAKAIYQQYMGGGSPTGTLMGQSPSAGGAAGGELSSPPDPRQYAGKRMQAPDGTIYKSDGSRWMRQ